MVLGGEMAARAGGPRGCGRRPHKKPARQNRPPYVMVVIISPSRAPITEAKKYGKNARAMALSGGHVSELPSARIRVCCHAWVPQRTGFYDPRKYLLLQGAAASVLTGISRKF